MSAQTSYDINQPKAYAGLIYAQAPKDVSSFSVETVAGIGFGLAVSRGTDPQRQIVVGGSDFVGITVRALDREGAINTGNILYKEKETAGVLRSGYVWANCVSGCTTGDAVKFNTTTGEFDAGAPGAGELAVSNAIWDTTAAATELAVIRIGV